MIQEVRERPLLMRELLGESLRELRTSSNLTLREVSGKARVSLGYLSEIERGQKEASSELLNAICGALDVPLSNVLRQVSDKIDDHVGVTALPVRAPHIAAA
ncbi:MAG: XRE family transcriptional regulator [Actinobacteria bacterium HGW-Actinobacteria-5]|jgi:transcriptional regulator with XRE-family HTH domain|nr:MAG: XRE family transcriptional regulator [Actinobacteria bacterium HGW-Actinobacteria-5]